MFAGNHASMFTYWLLVLPACFESGKSVDHQGVNLYSKTSGLPVGKFATPSLVHCAGQRYRSVAPHKGRYPLMGSVHLPIR